MPFMIRNYNMSLARCMPDAAGQKFTTTISSRSRRELHWCCCQRLQMFSGLFFSSKGTVDHLARSIRKHQPTTKAALAAVKVHTMTSTVTLAVVRKSALALGLLLPSNWEVERCTRSQCTHSLIIRTSRMKLHIKRTKALESALLALAAHLKLGLPSPVACAIHTAVLGSRRALSWGLGRIINPIILDRRVGWRRWW